MPYLSPEALQGLKEYTYKASGYTRLDDAHQPLWNYLVRKLPMWLAPNLITLSGLVGVLVGHLALAMYTPDFTGEAPSWVYILCGVSVVLYANLDCLDGKQARRTGSSSPLGQLFDHGIDAYIVHLLVGNIMACVSYGCGLRSVVGSIGIMLPWVLAQWEEYHTGNMVYGNGIWGVLESLYGTAGVHWITALFGPKFWKMHILKVSTTTVELLDLVLLGIFVLSIVQAIGQIWRVLNYDPKDLVDKERGRKTLGPKFAFWHLVCLLLMLGLGSAWIGGEATAPGECRAAFSAYGTVYSLVSTELIVAHMAKVPFEPSWWALTILASAALNTWFSLVPKHVFSFIALGVIGAGYLHYVLNLVDEICRFLGIWCLRIKSRVA